MSEKKRILVVEDEENIREAVVYSLSQEGFDVYSANDGEEGLNKAKSLKPIFPTLTFPNHYSIATGCYADKNRIISNTFYSKVLSRVYSMYDRGTVADSAFSPADNIFNDLFFKHSWI